MKVYNNADLKVHAKSSQLMQTENREYYVGKCAGVVEVLDIERSVIKQAEE